MPSRRSDAVLMLLSGAMALVSVACSNGNTLNRLSQADAVDNSLEANPAAVRSGVDAAPKPPASSVSVAPSANQASNATIPSEDPYPLALDKAYSAFSISESAQSQDDWNLVASRWQEAVSLMQSVPASSPHKAQAQNKIAEYRRNLAYAQKQATSISARPKPQPNTAIVVGAEPTTDLAEAPRSTLQASSSPAQPTASNQQVFQAKIKRRVNRTPVIDVRFNGNQSFEMIVDTGASGTAITQPMAAALGVVPKDKILVNTASARGIEVPVGVVNSMEVNGAAVKNVRVAIAGPELEIGLLGHDFFGNYDVTIKQDTVEFHER